MTNKKIIQRLLASFMLLTLCQTASAQQLQASRSHFTTEDGLCSNAISMLHQDDLGYIWIATWNGMSRFDGYNFYNYRTGNASHVKNLHNRILDLAIDQSQNVWMHMYDGRVFVLDRSTDKIINPFQKYKGNEDFKVTSPLLVTSSGEVLVSINNGHLYMLKLDRKGLTTDEMSSEGLRITSMAEGYQDDILIGTNKGVHRFDRKKLKLEKDGILMDMEITCLHTNGFNIYAGTSQGCIHSFAKGMEPQLLRKPNGMGIFSIFTDSKGIVWFCDDRMGASRLNPETGEEKFFQQNVPQPEYDGRGGVFNETHGTVWMVMNHGGFGYYNREKDEVEYFHNDPSNPWNLSNTVYTALELEEGVVWESTSHRGLDKLEIQKDNIVRKKLVANPTGALDNEIRAMFYDQQRKLLLIGNKSGDLYLKYDNGNQTIVNRDDKGQPFGRLYGISKSAKGDYWICSKDNGLFKMSPNGSGWTIRNYSHRSGDKQSLSSNNAYQAVEDKDGNVWVATYNGGVNLLPKGSDNFIHSGNGMTDYPKGAYTKVRTIAADAEGNVWAGTTDGILIMSYKDKNVKVEKLRMPENTDKILRNNDIVCIKKDSKGTMWVGTNGGGIGYTIGKDDTGAWLFDSFDAQDGLPSEEIRSITFDERGNAWFALEHMICSFDITKKICTSFSSLDGVGDVMISEGGATCAANGDVLFGTLDGYYVVDKKKLMGSTGRQMKLQITDFYLNDELQSPRLNSNFDYYVPMSKSVNIPHGNDSFAFRFASMNYQLQHRIHYQYMLEGYDEDWINAGKNRIAEYDDVTPGTYTFKVKAFLLESPEKYDIRTITVTVPNSYLTSPTAFTIYFLLLLTALIVIFVKYKKAVKALNNQ